MWTLPFEITMASLILSEWFVVGSTKVSCSMLAVWKKTLPVCSEWRYRLICSLPLCTVVEMLPPTCTDYLVKYIIQTTMKFRWFYMEKVADGDAMPMQPGFPWLNSIPPMPCIKHPAIGLCSLPVHESVRKVRTCTRQFLCSPSFSEIRASQYFFPDYIATTENLVPLFCPDFGWCSAKDCVICTVFFSFWSISCRLDQFCMTERSSKFGSFRVGQYLSCRYTLFYSYWAP